MKFHYLDSLLKDVKSFEDVPVLDASVYAQFNVHINKASRRLSAR